MIVLELGSGYSGKVVLVPGFVHVYVCVRDMSVETSADLLIEVINGTVGEVNNVLHILVPGVCRRVRTVAVIVVSQTIGVICRDIQPLGNVKDETVGHHKVVHLAGVLVPSVCEHAASS